MLSASTRQEVHLFATCLAQTFFPHTALAAADVLEDAGFHVRFNPRQTCCAQPAMNLGHREEARRLARATMALYEGDDAPVVVPSGSCAAMMAVHYPDLFDDESEKVRARAFAARVVEWSRFLVDSGYKPPQTPGPRVKVSLHPSCHALRELGVRDEPGMLLERAGFELVELPRGEECCGFGGAFSVVLPEASAAIMQAKLENVKVAMRDGAQVVASLDSGCLMHMRGGNERQAGCLEAEAGCPRYRHVAELLAEGIHESAGRDPDASSS